MAALVAAIGAALTGTLLFALTSMLWPTQAPTIGHLAALMLFPVLLALFLTSRR